MLSCTIKMIRILVYRYLSTVITMEYLFFLLQDNRYFSSTCTKISLLDKISVTKFYDTNLEFLGIVFIMEVLSTRLPRKILLNFFARNNMEM